MAVIEKWRNQSAESASWFCSVCPYARVLFLMTEPEID
jgi:hypothetical protein